MDLWIIDSFGGDSRIAKISVWIFDHETWRNPNFIEVISHTRPTLSIWVWLFFNGNEICFFVFHVWNVSYNRKSILENLIMFNIYMSVQDIMAALSDDEIWKIVKEFV